MKLYGCVFVARKDTKQNTVNSKLPPVNKEKKCGREEKKSLVQLLVQIK